ncbi:hypothetical protein BG004_001775, partial [Podila humilis]
HEPIADSVAVAVVEVNTESSESETEEAEASTEPESESEDHVADADVDVQPYVLTDNVAIAESGAVEQVDKKDSEKEVEVESPSAETETVHEESAEVALTEEQASCREVAEQQIKNNARSPTATTVADTHDSDDDMTCYTIVVTTAIYTTNTSSTIQYSSRRISRNTKASSFWVQEGMATFFDWITNPHNHQRLHKKNPVSGQEPKDIRQEIANVVNNKHNTVWTEDQVKSKIAYVKSKYREAAAAKKNSTGKEGAQQVSDDKNSSSNEQLEICPEFVRLHKVYGESLSANLPFLGPPPRQIANYGESHTAIELPDEDSSDLEDPSDTESHTGNAVLHRQVTDVIRFKLINKRHKGNNNSIFSSPSIYATSIDKLQQLLEQEHRIAYDDDIRSELRQRERAVEIRERDLVEKLLLMTEKTRERLGKELAAERAEFKKEMAEDEAEFKRKMAEFAVERDQLKMRMLL